MSRVFSAFVLFVVVGIVVLAWYGDHWMKAEFGDISSENSQRDWENTVLIEPSLIIPRPSTPLQSNYPQQPTEPTTQPTSTGATGGSQPTNTQVTTILGPTVVLATATPYQYAQTVQFTASFLKYALCSSQNEVQVNGIIDDAESQIQPIQTAYDNCKAVVQSEVEACISGCGMSLGCLQACGENPEYDTAFKACDNTYNSTRDPIVDSAISELQQYCISVVEK